MIGLSQNGKHPSPNGRRRPRTVLVLGSGGIKTVSHVGLFKVLRRSNIPIDLVVGSSGGSLFGAAYALGTDPEQIERWILQYWRKDLFKDYGYKELLKMFSPRRLSFDENFGIIKGDIVYRLLSRLFGRLTFDDVQMPLRIVATDLQSGESVVLREGSLVEAIRASIAIPVLFQPYRVDGRYLVDGALSSPIPVEHAIAEGADVIITMGFQSRMHPRIDTPLRLITQLMRISGNRLYRSELAYHACNPAIEIVPIETECGANIGMRDVEEIPALIRAGEEAAEESLPKIRRTLEEFSSVRNRTKRHLRVQAQRLFKTPLREEHGS